MTSTIIILIITLIVSIGVSFLCSLMEAAFYAISMPYVQYEAKKGSKSGKLLLDFKEDMGKPISAILILNTVAHTAGASVAGWATGEVFGPNALLPFSVAYTLAILYLSEILPKLVGVVYSKTVAKFFAFPLLWLIKILSPLIHISDWLAKKIKSNHKEEEVSPEEMLSMAEIGTKEGSLDNLEGAVIENIIELDQILIRTVMTPRTVVVRFLETLTLNEISSRLNTLAFSRIPLYDQEEPDTLTGYVTQRDILLELVKGNKEKKLEELARPLKVVPDLMRCDSLLLDMFNSNEHLYSVVDEYGGLAGIITLEDVIEKIVGHEIVDEYDAVSNLRAVARLLRFKKCQEQLNKKV